MVDKLRTRGNFGGQKIMSAYKVEQITRQKRIEEQRIADLHQYANKSQQLTMAARNETRVTRARQCRVAARVAADHLEEERQKIELNRRKQKEIQDAQNDVLASQMNQRNDEKEKIEREIQRIIETSEELQDLERNLRIAYINKERAAQHQEILLLRKMEARREQILDEAMEESRQRSLMVEKERNEQRRSVLINQKSALKSQILEHQKLKEKEKEEALHDKQMVDAIIAKINDEDRCAFESNERKKKYTRRMVEDFQKERARKKKELEQEERRHDEEIRLYQDKMAQRVKEEAASLQAMEEEKRRRWSKVAQETKRQTQTQDEYNELRDMLYQEEMEAKRIQEERDRIRRQEAIKEETMRQNRAQIIAKKEMLMKEEEEESRLVQVMLDKFSKDEEDELQRARAREEARKGFVREIRGQMEERTKLFKMEKEKEISEHKASIQQEKYRKQLVAEARKRLLSKHAAQVRGFLPKGALAHSDEVDVLRDSLTTK